MKSALTTLVGLVFVFLTLSMSVMVQGATGNLDAAPAVAWEQMPMQGEAYSIFQLSKGFVLSAANDSATFLIKTDSEGNITDLTTIQINHEPTQLPYLVPTSDGGYVFAGIWNNQYALVKTDLDGNVLWTKQYSSDAPINYFRSIIQTRDGGFALAGFGEPSEESEGWIWFARTDANGNLAWNETLAGPLADCPSNIIELENGDFMLSDVSYSIVPNQAYIRLIRTSPDGIVLWNQTYGGEGNYKIPECNCAIQTQDGGFIIGGFLSGQNAWVIKTDPDCQMEWNQTYGGKHSAITCIRQISDGYIMTAVANLTQAWVLKTDAVGNALWNVTFPGAIFPVGLEANFVSVLPTQDGGYVMVGTKDVLVWLVKLAGPKPNFTIVIGAVVVAVALVALIIVLRIQRHKPKKQPTANFSHF
jgi:hypothetical protein